MITKTITWSLFQQNGKTIGFEDLGLIEPTNESLEAYLNNLKSLKKRFNTEGVSDIAVYHTVFYEGQCNTEFSPKITALLQELNATFCISAYDLKPTKILKSVVVDEKYALHEVVESYSKELNEPIPFTDDDTNEVYFMDIDASNLSNRQVFELGLRYGQRTEFDKKAKPKNLYDTLDLIRERPSLYTGEHSISSIYHFINGFYMACDHETSENPSFDGFNDFVGKFYGKYTTAGWKNLILSDHYGNETEALTRFYELLDEYREKPSKPNARHIIHQLLHEALVDTSLDIDHRQQVLDLLKPASEELHSAIYMRLLSWYETLLEDIFMRARDSDFLHNWIKKYAPTTVFYEYELWHGSNGKETNTTLIAINHKQKAAILNDFEVLVDTFFAINEDKAKAVKEDFLDTLSRQ